MTNVITSSRILCSILLASDYILLQIPKEADYAVITIYNPFEAAFKCHHTQKELTQSQFVESTTKEVLSDYQNMRFLKNAQIYGYRKSLSIISVYLHVMTHVSVNFNANFMIQFHGEITKRASGIRVFYF